VTAPATAPPALSSLLLATVPAAAGATLPGAAGQAASVAPGTPQSAGFQALLLGLRGATATPGAGGTPAATAATTTAGAADPLLANGIPAPVAGGASPPVTDLRAANPGADAGEDLPADGTTLPPADPTTLLAALESATPALPPPTAPTPPAPAAGVVPATPGPAAGGSAAPLAAIAGQAGGNAAATRTRVAGEAPSATGTDAAADTATDAPVGDAPADTATAAAADATTTSLNDFRARLAAMLAPVDRPGAFSDAGNGGAAFAPAGAVGATAATAATTAPATDPLLDNLPVLEPLGDADAWSRGVGERVLMMADRGLQSATIKLQPEHLGPMEIRIQVDDDGTAQVNFSAQHAQTRDALETAIPRLRELLADQGLSLSQANVDAGGRGGFAQRAFGNEPPPWLRWGGAAEAEAEPETLAWRVARPSERRLDVLV